MSAIEILLAIISIISFGLAIFSFLRNEIHKANEKAKVEVMRERLNVLYRGLSSLYHSADSIVQIPKTRENVTVGELQNIARLLRSQIYSQAELIKKSRGQLDRWRFGKMVPSERMDDILSAQKPKDINKNKAGENN